MSRPTTFDVPMPTTQEFTMQPRPATEPARLPPMLTVPQAARVLGIGRTLAYELVRTGATGAISYKFEVARDSALAAASRAIASDPAACWRSKYASETPSKASFVADRMPEAAVTDDAVVETRKAPIGGTVVVGGRVPERGARRYVVQNEEAPPLGMARRRSPRGEAEHLL